MLSEQSEHVLSTRRRHKGPSPHIAMNIVKSNIAYMSAAVLAGHFLLLGSLAMHLTRLTVVTLSTLMVTSSLVAASRLQRRWGQQVLYKLPFNTDSDQQTVGISNARCYFTKLRIFRGIRDSQIV